MAGFILPLGLGAVAGLFLIIVTGEAFYLFYWRKRPLYPRGNSIPVAPITEGEAVGARDPAGETEVVIDVTCAEYQIATLHQDLVEKLFPAPGVTCSEIAKDLMGPTRMLFTITEETKEELEHLDFENNGNRRQRSQSKSTSDISFSPVGPFSPLSSTTFVTPASSPDHFVSPYGTPTYSPLVTLNRSQSASPNLVKACNRILGDRLTGTTPADPSCPTRPSFSFLSRGSPPNQTPLPPSTPLETSEWVSPYSSRHFPNNLSTFYSPPRKPFYFSTPVNQSKEVGVLKVTSPLRSCTFVYENGTFSPSTTPSSPQCCASSPLISHTLSAHFLRENHEFKNSMNSTPPLSSPSAVSSYTTPYFNDCAASDAVGATSLAGSPCRPSSQRSSSMLFCSALSRPALTPVLAQK